VRILLLLDGDLPLVGNIIKMTGVSPDHSSYCYSPDLHGEGHYEMMAAVCLSVLPSVCLSYASTCCIGRPADSWLQNWYTDVRIVQFLYAYGAVSV